MALDSLATNLVAVRRARGDGVMIKRLRGTGPDLELEGDEWIDLIGLVLSVIAYSEWASGDKDP